jgi:hypothetical protein
MTGHHWPTRVAAPLQTALRNLDLAQAGEAGFRSFQYKVGGLALSLLEDFQLVNILFDFLFLIKSDKISEDFIDFYSAIFIKEYYYYSAIQ